MAESLLVLIIIIIIKETLNIKIRLYCLYSTMLYAIVAFDTTKEVDWAPVNWLKEQNAIPELIREKSSVTVYWPPKSWATQPIKMLKAKRLFQDPELGWDEYMGRILSTARKYKHFDRVVVRYYAVYVLLAYKQRIIT
jgi:hypothetical protein